MDYQSATLLRPAHTILRLPANSAPRHIPFIAPAKIAHGTAVAAFGTAAIPVKRHCLRSVPRLPPRPRLAACQIMHGLQIATLCALLTTILWLRCLRLT